MRFRAPNATMLGAVAIALIAAVAAFVFVGASSRGGHDSQGGGAAQPGYRVRLARFEPDATTIENCYDKAYRKRLEKPALGACLSQAYGNIAFKRSPREALALLARNEKKVSTQLTSCHAVAHQVGGAAFEHYKGNTGKALADGAILCGSGYYHGVLQRSLQTVDDKQIDDQAPRLCAGVAPGRAISIQCGHGLGHSVMLATGYDLPRSLRLCERQPATSDKGACYSGAFMENQDTEFGLRSKFLRTDDLVYPCNSRKVVPAGFAENVCYAMLASSISTRVGSDLAKTAHWCGQVPPEHKAACFTEWGQLAGQRSNFDTAKLNTGCRTLREYRFESFCWRGASLMKVEFSGNAMEGVKICNDAPSYAAGNCWYGIGKRLNMTTLGSLKDAPRTCAQLTRDRVLARRCQDGVENRDDYKGNGVYPKPDPPYPA